MRASEIAASAPSAGKDVERIGSVAFSPTGWPADAWTTTIGSTSFSLSLSKWLIASPGKHRVQPAERGRNIHEVCVYLRQATRQRPQRELGRRCPKNGGRSNWRGKSGRF